MASGKKNYFRHSFSARNDEVLIDAYHKFGARSYYFWFALIELCAEQISETCEEVCKFHESRLKRELRCSERTLRPLLDYFASTSKVVYNYSENFYEVEVVNLSKYLGFYKTKKNQTTPKERKEKEIKEKKTKAKASVSVPHKVKEIFDTWNKHRGGLPEAKLLNAKRKKSIKARLVEHPDLATWVEVVKRLAASDFCNGGGSTGWVASFDFLLQPNTIAKTLEGAYDNRTPKPKNNPSLEVQKISEAISRFGRYNHEDARKFVGELGWSAVQSVGGWSVVCSDNFDFTKPKLTRAIKENAVLSFQKGT